MYATRGGFGAKRKENKEEVSEGLGCGRLNDLVCPVTGRRKAGVGPRSPLGVERAGGAKAGTYCFCREISCPFPLDFVSS